MTADKELIRILNRAMEGNAPDRNDCIRLLQYPENSLLRGDGSTVPLTGPNSAGT